jgi:hypothetical protein
MTIPFGPRRLVIAFVAAPDRVSERPEAAGATDRELARLARPFNPDAMRDQLTTMALMYRVGLH